MSRWRRNIFGLTTMILVAGCGAGETLVSSACRAAEFEFSLYTGEEGDGFISIGGIAAGDDGTVYLLDGGEGSLIAFSPEGAELWRARGREAGLAEFTAPVGLHRVDSLLVFEDVEKGLLAFWTESGERAHSIELDSLHLPGRAVWVGSLGGEVVGAVVEDDGDELGPPRLALLLAVAGYGVVDTLAVLDAPAPQVVYMGDYAVPVDPPYSASPVFAVSPDGSIAASSGGEYRVEVFKPTGERHAVIRSDAGAPAVGAADIRAFGRLLPDTLLLGQLVFPDHHPAITALAATADGHLLVRTAWVRRGEVRWDRWSLEGEYVDSFQLPVEMEPVTGIGNLIHGRAVDETGEHHLAVYNLAGRSTCAGPAASPPTGGGA